MFLNVLHSEIDYTPLNKTQLFADYYDIFKSLKSFFANFDIVFDFYHRWMDKHKERFFLIGDYSPANEVRNHIFILMTGESFVMTLE